MRSRTTILSIVTGMFLAATLAGCPGQGSDTFEVWLVNASRTSDIADVEMINDNDNTQRATLLQDRLALTTTRIISDVDVTLFEGHTATVEVTVDALVQGGGGSTVLVNVATQVDESIQAGDVIPIVVYGDHSGDINVEFAGLDPQSKLNETVQNLALSP